MARVAFTEFKAASCRSLPKSAQWLIARPEVVATLVEQHAAGERVSTLYAWLASDPDDPPPFQANTLSVTLRSDTWQEIRARAGV